MEVNNRRELIRLYFSLGFKQFEIRASLNLMHNVSISSRQLKRELQSMRLYRRRYFSDLRQVISFVERQLQTSSRLHGYRWMHNKCIQNSLVVSQNTIRLLLEILDPEGLDFRRRRRLRRRQYFTKGPNFVWHLDGYDKLKPFGICINGCIDGFSRHIIWLQAGSNNSQPSIIAGYYINAVKNLRGCPKKVRSDMGTENVLVERMQLLLKNDQNNDNASFIYGRSPANQRIEAWWSILRKHNSQFWMNLFNELKDEECFDGSFIDKSLVQFCFLKIIQEELDTIALEWNMHTISASRNQISPNGRPYMMYNMPEIYDARNYLQSVESVVVEACEDLCTFVETPCDELVFELAMIIISENNLQVSNNVSDAVNLYKELRWEILNLLE